MIVFPVPLYQGRRAVVSSGFREPSRPTHEGTDLMFRRLPGEGAPGQHLPSFSEHYFMPNDTLPALAIADGVVEDSREIGTGGYVVVAFPELGLTGQYMHLRRRQVQQGDRVRAGQPVGAISFNASGYQLAHLHFQLRRGASGSLGSRPLLDPAPLIAGLPAISNPWAGRQALLILAAAGLVGLLAYRYFTKTSSSELVVP